MKPNYIKIDGSDELVKDTDSGAILNTNVNALNAYRTRRNLLESNRCLANELTAIKQELEEMRILMRESLEKNKWQNR